MSKDGKAQQCKLCLHMVHSLNCLQQSRMGQAEASSQELPMWVVKTQVLNPSSLFPRQISRDLDQKWSSEVLTGYRRHKWRSNLLCQNARLNLNVFKIKNFKKKVHCNRNKISNHIRNQRQMTIGRFQKVAYLI